MIRSIKVKTFIKLFLLLLTAAMLGALIYVNNVLNSIPSERLELILSQNKKRTISPLAPNILEEGSLINEDEFQAYMKFSDSKNPLFLNTLNLQKNKNFNKIKGSLYSVNEEVQLPPLLVNDCPNVNCYQHRIAFDYLPSFFWKGLIGIEDYRFLNHPGVDLKSILRALIVDLKEMKFVQGGSTLTQQLVKNLFLTNEKSLSRKIKELIMAVYIERKFPKENIIEAYFNEFVWGTLQGVKIKGLYSASLFYFGRKPTEISNYQAAILIGLLKGPYYFNPMRNLKKLRKRADLVYKKLVELNMFPEGKKEKWRDSNWSHWAMDLKRKEKQRPYRSMINSLDNKSGNFNNYEKFVFYNKVFQVKSRIQKKVGLQNFSVKAMIGEIENPSNSFSFYSKFSRNKIKAIEEESHQLGSILKPLIYSFLRKRGIPFDRDVSTAPLTISYRKREWSPKEPSKYLPEFVKVEDALLKSYNRPLIRLVQEVGFSNIESDLLDYLPNLKTPLKEYPAQLLGATELTIKESFGLFSRFIDKECLNSENVEKNIISLMADPRKTTVSRLVDKYLKKLRFFGKTGTSNKGYDNWFVYFDGKNLGVIWFGWEGRRDLKDFKIYGGSTSFRIFQLFYRERGRRFNELTCSDGNSEGLEVIGESNSLNDATGS